MTFIDSLILDAVERACRRFQALTGRTNVWIAVQLTNVSIVVYFVAAVVYLLKADVGFRIALGLVCVVLLYVLSQTVLKVPVEASEQSAYQRVARGLRNPRRVRDLMLRVLFLMLSLLTTGPVSLAYLYTPQYLPVAYLSYSLILLTTVLLYVLACDPLPPQSGVVREWLKRLAAARKTQPSASTP